MTRSEADSYFSSDARYRLFTSLKYLVYALLSLNIFLFLQEELLALEHTFVDDFELGDIVQVFSATIDTAAWVILLLLFELETSVLDDSRITGPVKWTIHAVRGVCTLAIVYAFTGYYSELITLYQVTALPGFDACSNLDQSLSLLLGMDDYAPLDASNCVSLAGEAYRLNGFDIVAGSEPLQAARWLAWTDVINAADWILIVILLEIEVRLQLRGNLSDGIMGATKYVKLTLYAILFIAAIYWGFAGSFLDFWDACLWLFAFIFIELNVFEWQRGTSQQAA